MMRVNRRTLSEIVSASILLGLASFSINLFGNDLDLYGDSQVSTQINNPHQIPDRFNPRLISAHERSDHFYQVADSSMASVQTLHSMAFDKSVAYTSPTLDYTTGTSN